MRLYHFLPEEYGLDNIRRRRLKIARVNELNDPFEFGSVNFSDEAIRQAFRVMKNEMSERRGLLCFSKKWSNPVIWSHYADRHRGVCLGFDVPDDSVDKVSYSRRRLVVKLESLKSPRDLRVDEVRELLFTKYSHWRYENEYRAFVTLNDIDEESGLFFTEFSERLALKEVIVGAESNISREQLSKVLGKELQHVEQIKARLAFRTFSVVKQRKKTLWA